MPGTFLELVLLLAKCAWGVLLFLGVLALVQGLPSERPGALALLAGLAVAAWAYRVPIRRWRERGRTDPVPPAEGSGRTDQGESMPETLAWLGIPLDTSTGTAEAALSGALARTTVFRAHEQVLARQPGQALALLEPLLSNLDLDPRVAGVAHYVRAAACVQFGEKEAIVASLERARALYPGNPVIERAWESLAAMFPQERSHPGFYAPSMAGTREVRRHALGPDHFAILSVHPPPDAQAGTIKVAHSLAVHASADGSPRLYVAAELNRSYAPDREGSASHFLGLYPGEGHANLGASNEWADLAAFEARALQVARDHLGLG
jgi:hypothetical protein